ncbi:MAG: hypothetical protein KOO66_07720 [Bacteroidales bacterium]|nr:hypothetical protein [Bacteroidales bacterium]
MVSKNFYFKLIVQIFLILISSAAASYFYFESSLILIPLNIVFLIIFQSILLIRYINKFNKKIAFHLESLTNNDYTHFKSLKSKNKAFKALDYKLKILYDKLKNAEIEKTLEYEYHKYSIEHVNVGLISYNKENGKIKYINKAAKELLSIKTLINIKKLTEVSEELLRVIRELNSGQSKLFKLLLDNELLQLSVKISEFKLLDEKIRLVSIQNIKNEIEESELDSWQKLIRILTHEIMNSIAPITSATKSLHNFLTVDGSPKKSSKISDKIIEDSVTGLEAIQIRSNGLLNFVKQYRSLTNLPDPNYTKFRVTDLFKHIETLMKNELEREDISLEISILNEDLALTADFNLIVQIIINLITNSVFALQAKTNKLISLVAQLGKNEKPEIIVIDNGEGVPSDNLDKIFIPFFTTRYEGSGIGLSLVRQIMHLHNGNITVHSRPDEATRFILSF